MKNNKGFSLIELIIVIAILAIMGGVLIGSTGFVGNARVKKCVSLMDEFMKKTRVEAMSKSDVSGVQIYAQDGIYYIESYYETVDAEGNPKIVKKEDKEIGSVSDLNISLSKEDDTDKMVLNNNQNSELSSYIRIQYTKGTGGISKIYASNQLKMDATKISVTKGDRSQCIQIVPVTGKQTIK